jgi:ATPase subunit of ABC transporter with duplicated ATPase domains
MRQQAERSARKNSRGARERDTGSQSRLLLDAMRDRAERSSGALAERHGQRRDQLHQEVTEAFAAFDGALERPVFPELGLAIPQGQETLVLDALVQDWAWSRPLDWTAKGPVRVALRGPNGCGKSTLLRLMAGLGHASSGTRRSPLHAALLDQSLALLDRQASLLGQLQAVAPACPEGRLRQYLALAGIGTQRLRQPCGTLSGGEQTRGALLRAVLSQPQPGMLLLDEATNHLDLAATEALEAMLRSWKGVLVVASHDDAFLRRIAPDYWIERDGEGWVVRED